MWWYSGNVVVQWWYSVTVVQWYSGTVQYCYVGYSGVLWDKCGFVGYNAVM